MRIKVFNPYMDKEHEVIESRDSIENALWNIRSGYEDFIVVHTTDGKIVTLSPRNLASIEVEGGAEEE